MSDASGTPNEAGVDARGIAKRGALFDVLAVVAAVGVGALPGVDEVRDRLANADPRWLVAAPARRGMIVRMADEDADRNSFEDLARALADDVRRALERVSEIDVDELARTASAEAERAREWFEELARRWGRPGATGWGAGFGDAPAAAPDPGSVADDPLGHAGPSPLDVPTADQGRALAALDSGRWKLEPGTSALAVHGDGPAPRDALGLVRELRARDWLSVDGELTLAGRHALKRWLEASAA